MSDHITPSRRRRTARASVGVRELKTHAARILRHVREARASYILTHRGQAVGVILPLDASEAETLSADDGDASAGWHAFLRAGQRLQTRFRAGANGVRLLSEMRR